MKNQCILLFLSLIAMGFSSCTTYYYSTIHSNDRKVEKIANGDFVQENDTVSITYCFYGEELPIEITIYNKLDRPLFLDWQQSALVVEEAATGRHNQSADTRGEMYSNTYTYRDYLFPHTNYNETFGNFAGESNTPEGIAFIPPKSMINSTPITLANLLFDRIPNEAYTKVKYATNDTSLKNVKEITFTEENSPLRFRSYLTLYTIAENGSREKPIVSEQSFYISQLIKSGGLSPNEVPAYTQKRGDFFYYGKEKATNFSVAAGIMAIGVAGIVIDSAISPRRY